MLTAKRRLNKAKNIKNHHGYSVLIQTGFDFFLSKKLSKYERFKLNTRYNNLINRLRYDTAPNPYKIVWVNREQLTYSFRPRNTFKSHGLAQIRRGNWKPTTPWKENNPIYLGLKQRFEQNYVWKNTEYVDWARKKIEENGSKFGHSTVGEFIEERCEFVENLYYNMKKKGWEITKETPVKHSPNELGKDRVSSISPLETIEIPAVINKNGEIYIADGNHRLTIAEILDIESIPMHVLIRHEKWQKFRDDLYNGNNPVSRERYKELSQHPDLQDIT